MSLLSPNRLKARLAPHLHWRVPFEAGVYANSPRWSNKGSSSSTLTVDTMLTTHSLDLDPVPVHMRTWGGTVSKAVFSNKCTVLLYKGLLGILDVRHARATTRKHCVICYGPRIHC